MIFIYEVIKCEVTANSRRVVQPNGRGRKTWRKMCVYRMGALRGFASNNSIDAQFEESRCIGSWRIIFISLLQWA